MKTLKWKTHADMAIERNPTVEREEYLDYMAFRRNARPLFTEPFGPLIGLKEEWEEQGATPEELSFAAFRYRCPIQSGVPVNVAGWLAPLPRRTIEDNDRLLIYIDGRGRTMKLFKQVATLPLPMDYPVQTMDDWLRIKPQYEFSERRFGDGWAERARAGRDRGASVSVHIPGGFDEPRQLMGEENICLAFYEQPELIRDMLQTMATTAARVLDRVTSQVDVDILSVHEDMAGKSGSLIGPAHIREYVAPYYRAAWDVCNSRGAVLFDQDSDGNMNSVIDAFIDAGVNCMHPMEPAAGMDIVEIRRKYGTRLAFHGGIDKHVIRRTKEEIEAELEYKIPPMVATGGCVLGLDHRIPNGTPLDNYRFYVRKAWEIMEREASR